LITTRGDTIAAKFTNSPWTGYYMGVNIGNQMEFVFKKTFNPLSVLGESA
jgi:hypothetical protein